MKRFRIQNSKLRTQGIRIVCPHPANISKNPASAELLRFLSLRLFAELKIMKRPKAPETGYLVTASHKTHCQSQYSKTQTRNFLMRRIPFGKIDFILKTCFLFLQTPVNNIERKQFG